MGHWQILRIFMDGISCCFMFLLLLTIMEIIFFSDGEKRFGDILERSTNLKIYIVGRLKEATSLSIFRRGLRVGKPLGVRGVTSVPLSLKLRSVPKKDARFFEFSLNSSIYLVFTTIFCFLKLLSIR